MAEKKTVDGMSIKKYLLANDPCFLEHMRKAGTCLVSFNYERDGAFINELKAEGVSCQELTYDSSNSKWLSTYIRMAKWCDTLLFVGDSFTSSAIRRERTQIVKIFRDKGLVMTNGWRDGKKKIEEVEFKPLSWDRFYINFVAQGAISVGDYFRTHPRLKQAQEMTVDVTNGCQCVLM